MLYQNLVLAYNDQGNTAQAEQVAAEAQQLFGDYNLKRDNNGSLCCEIMTDNHQWRTITIDGYHQVYFNVLSRALRHKATFSLRAA